MRHKSAPCPRLRIPRRIRRQAQQRLRVVGRQLGEEVLAQIDDPSPDRSTIELNRHSVGRNYGALIPIESPNSAGIVDIASRGLTDFVHEIEIPTVLRDVSQPCLTGGTVDAEVTSREIYLLRDGRYGS